MDMDGKFHIHGNPGNFTQSIPIALVSREQDRLQCALKDTVAYSRFTQFARQCIPDGRTPTEKARRPSVLRRYRGTIKRCRLADRQCRLATSATEVQQLTRYLGALFSRHRRTDHDSQLILHAFNYSDNYALQLHMSHMQAACGIKASCGM